MRTAMNITGGPLADLTDAALVTELRDTGLLKQPAVLELLQRFEYWTAYMARIDADLDEWAAAPLTKPGQPVPIFSGVCNFAPVGDAVDDLAGLPLTVSSELAELLAVQS